MWFSIVMFVYQRVKLLLLCWVYHIGPGWSVSLRLPTSVSHEKVRFKHSIGTHNVLQTIEGLISIFHEHQCTIYTQQVKQQGKHAGFQCWWCVECMWPPDSIKCTADPQEKKQPRTWNSNLLISIDQQSTHNYWHLLKHILGGSMLHVFRTYTMQT